MSPSPKGGNVEQRLFGPEWYTFVPHHWQPSRGVVSSSNVPAGSVYYDDTLECGHVVRGMTGQYEVRRCPECLPQLPYLDRDVTLIEDAVVPYEPGHPRKKGWCFVTDPETKVPS